LIQLTNMRLILEGFTLVLRYSSPLRVHRKLLGTPRQLHNNPVDVLLSYNRGKVSFSEETNIINKCKIAESDICIQQSMHCAAYAYRNKTSFDLDALERLL